jgi:DNA-binding transcriptional ArsR family regulator
METKQIDQTPPPSIEEIFKTKGRVQILKILAKAGELNISAICSQARMNHQVAKRHLQILSEVGVVQEKIFGRIKIYRLRIENLRVQGIKNLIELWQN